MNYLDRYRQWLRDFSGDAKTVEELEKIADAPKEIEDRFYRDLSFGTAGMRGVIGAGTNRMNIYTVRRVTKALAEYIKGFAGGAARGVAIAFDSRHFSDVFAREAALVLANEGVRAHLFDALRPVPVLSFAVRDLHTIAGIVITASHNPSIYNGYKVYWEDGGQLAPERADAITQKIAEVSYTEARPMDERAARDANLLSTIPPSLDDRYIAAVKKLAVNPALTRRSEKNLKSSIRRCTVRAICRCAESSAKSAWKTYTSCPNRNFPTEASPQCEFQTPRKRTLSRWPLICKKNWAPTFAWVPTRTATAWAWPA